MFLACKRQHVSVPDQGDCIGGVYKRYTPSWSLITNDWQHTSFTRIPSFERVSSPYTQVSCVFIINLFS